MRPAARVVAAIDIVSEILDRGRAASIVLSDWARANRFAGSADRAAIGNLVYDALRKKQSLAYAMGDERPRALTLAVLARQWELPLSEIEALCSGVGFAPAPLTDDERQGLLRTDLTDAPPWVQGDYPEWLHPSFSEVFGADAVLEGAALSERAPVDLRVNTLKSTPEKVLKALDRHRPEFTPYSPIGVRLPARKGAARSPNVEADAGHARGWFEIQDEGSQLTALLAGAAPRLQIADICAGSGGKTLALSAVMQNTGQIYAYDADPTRFRPIFDRLKRAGARNVQTLPAGREAALAALKDRLDLVLIDAPCTGTGVWRRRPDAKWRLTSAQLAERQSAQRQLLGTAASLLKAGGRLAYITCSVLPEENSVQIQDFLQHNSEFSPVDLISEAPRTLFEKLASQPAKARHGILLTPHTFGTDGFFISVLRKLG